MKNIKDMTNTEFVTHLMTYGSKYGPMVETVVIDCLQRGLDHYISRKEKILEEHNNPREDGRISLINMEAWVDCCEVTKERMNEKYNPNA